jgi:hypothetical protein
MTRRAKCPMCKDGMLTASEGKLDQSGGTYLPTTTWSCDVCGCVRYDGAKASAWRGREASDASVARAA